MRPWSRPSWGWGRRVGLTSAQCLTGYVGPRSVPFAGTPRGYRIGTSRMDPDRRRRYQRRLETSIGVEHSPTSATGTGWERAPWHATQRAAWEALKKTEETNR